MSISRFILVTTFIKSSLLTTLLVYTMIRFLSRLKKPRPKSGLSFCYMWNCRYSILHHPQQLKPHDRLPIWCVLVEPMEGLPSFCLSRLSHRRSPTFKTSLVSDTIVRKGAVLRQLMRERPKSSSTEVHIKQKLLSVFYPLTNYTYSVSDSHRNVKSFLK